ncbi:MAG: U32 family peptidase [Porphyromonadaceae bacterium]|nr:MAG: U32 family peptidase [Porphyromonadaceae bacterium]
MTGLPYNREAIEVMAPAGSFESLRAAISGGANAVYFGVEHLNMRSKSARNFLTSDLPLIARYCKFSGVKSYLTLNTIIYDQEITLSQQLIDAAAEAGISAIIVSDQSVIEYARNRGMPLHLSTQLNISNFETLRFYAKYADVMVLARELTLDQISAIAGKIGANSITGPSGEPVRLELFVHGALCMAISGKCHLSLHQYNSSANRGNCLQACRRAYRVEDIESGDQLEIDQEYIMSPKDLSTIHFLDRIIASGITVLKIEGRARPAEYVQTVTSCYREAVDSLFDGTYVPEKIEQWKERLSTVFNRGFWDGYYLGQRLGEWSSVYGSAATKRKIFIGTATNYYSRLGVGEFDIQSECLTVGEEVLITGPTTGLIQITIREIHNNGGQVQTALKGERIAFRTGRKIRRGDKLFKWVNQNLSPNNKPITNPDDMGS